jgi:fructokinase
MAIRSGVHSCPFEFIRGFCPRGAEREGPVRFKLVGIGEVLWDLLPGGRQLGGAPANFVCHACALGAEARLISRVGNDALGREALDRLEKLGVPTDCIEVDPKLPTGTVSVEVTPDGQPRFQIHENVAWDALSGEAGGQAAVAAAAAVCFGTLAQRREPSRATIRSLVAAAPPAALRILDVNLRQDFYSREIIEESMALANVLKVNDAELPRLAEIFQQSGDERAQIEALARRFSLRCVACTRGARGSLLFSGGSWSDHPGTRTNVVDTVGAGDAFSAAMTLGLLSGWSLNEINRLANDVAAYVCSQPGATPELPEQLRDAFAPARSNASSKPKDGPRRHRCGG